MSIISDLLNCSKEERIQASELLVNHPDTAPIFEAKITSILEAKLTAIKEELRKAVKQESIESYNSPEFIKGLDCGLTQTDVFSQMPRRIRDLECTTGLRAYYDDEDHEPTIPEKITEMKEKINSFESARVIVAANMEPEINEDLLIQNTTLTQKANALTEYLKEKIKPSWSGKTVIENEKIYDFFYNIVNKEIRWPAKMKGYRNAKKLIIERAVELHPDDVEIVRNKSGNKITGLALKASIKRIGSYGC